MNLRVGRIEDHETDAGVICPRLSGEAVEPIPVHLAVLALEVEKDSVPVDGRRREVIPGIKADDVPAIERIAEPDGADDVAGDVSLDAGDA